MPTHLYGNVRTLVQNVSSTTTIPKQIKDFIEIRNANSAIFYLSFISLIESEGISIGREQQTSRYLIHSSEIPRISAIYILHFGVLASRHCLRCTQTLT